MRTRWLGKGTTLLMLALAGCGESPAPTEQQGGSAGTMSGGASGIGGTGGTASGTAGTGGTASGAAGTSGTASGAAGTGSGGTASGTGGTAGAASGTAGVSAGTGGSAGTGAGTSGAGGGAAGTQNTGGSTGGAFELEGSWLYLGPWDGTHTLTIDHTSMTYTDVDGNWSSHWTITAYDNALHHFQIAFDTGSGDYFPDAQALSATYDLSGTLLSIQTANGSSYPPLEGAGSCTSPADGMPIPDCRLYIKQ